MDEYVPVITPTRNVKAKSLITVPPKKYKVAVESNVVPEVMMVRS